MRPDDISEGFGPVGTNGPSLIERLRTPLSMDLFASKDHMIRALLGEREEAADALEAAREDAERWNELCRQIDAGEFHPSILDDAMNMGAGALEMHVDDAIDAAREARNG